MLFALYECKKCSKIFARILEMLLPSLHISLFRQYWLENQLKPRPRCESLSRDRKNAFPSGAPCGAPKPAKPIKINVFGSSLSLKNTSRTPADWNKDCAIPYSRDRLMRDELRIPSGLIVIFDHRGVARHHPMTGDGYRTAGDTQFVAHEAIAKWGMAQSSFQSAGVRRVFFNTTLWYAYPLWTRVYACEQCFYLPMKVNEKYSALASKWDPI